jgi:predicted dehydrogenase
MWLLLVLGGWFDRRMTPPLRVALLGYGLAGRVFHAPLVQAEPSLRLVTVVTSDPTRAAQARRDVPGVTVLPTADEVWARPGEHDLAVVATANVAHQQQVEAALAARLPVVVDKPLAADAATAARLVDLASTVDVPLHVFQNRRWDSDLLTVRALMAAGRLGEVLRLESRFERWRPERESGWRTSPDPAQHGGLLLDLGSHLADQALLLLGPAVSVYAEARSVRDPEAPEDDVFVAITHAGGAVSHLWAGALVAAPGPRVRVLGTRGAFVLAHPDGQEAALAAGERPGPGWGEEPPAHWGRLLPADEPVPSVPGAWPAYYAQVAAALRGEGPPPVEPADVVAALRVLDAARTSARTGQVVALA